VVDGELPHWQWLADREGSPLHVDCGGHCLAAFGDWFSCCRCSTLLPPGHVIVPTVSRASIDVGDAGSHRVIVRLEYGMLTNRLDEFVSWAGRLVQHSNEVACFANQHHAEEFCRFWGLTLVSPVEVEP